MTQSREGQVTFVGAERLVKTTLQSSTKVGLLRKYFCMNILQIMHLSCEKWNDICLSSSSRCLVKIQSRNTTFIYRITVTSVFDYHNTIVNSV